MSGAELIHASIIRHLETSDMVLCDLSSHNPNVFFELGVRTSLNLPIALVRDEFTTLPFDTSSINTATYRSALHGWNTTEDVTQLAAHIRSSYESCDGSNPLWQAFGLRIRASEAVADQGEDSDPRVDLLLQEMTSLRKELAVLGTQVGQDSSLPRREREFLLLSANSGEASAKLNEFMKAASVFSTDSDDDLHWYFAPGDSSTAFVPNHQLESVPLASRRALLQMAKDRNVGIARLP
ncbi:hypothetical protein [Nocardioides sp. LHG3406-4]|uniref:hypothetical protein n=1 Tax=Nocardioides sp. LHG3406-4 TaxID=2804575 RepID=UPI003CEA9F8C